MIYGATGHLDLHQIAQVIASGGADRLPLVFGTVFIVAAFAFKRSEEHTSELQSLMRISYAVFCLKKKNNKNIQVPLPINTTNHQHNEISQYHLTHDRI